MKSKNGGYLTLKIKLLNSRLFNRYLSMDSRVLYSAEQGKILSALWDNHPQTASELSYITGLANSSLSIMLKRLETQGLIVSILSEEDKRKRMFDLTSIGANQEKIGNEISNKLSEVFYKGFSDQEIKDVERYLSRILDNLEKESANYGRRK
ncbi:MarR family transcriptional regulator [Priestia megaterium]|uniref:MarR family transcriptional regulator n=1 Tax=Priestia megaterium TaxID=1404 RepID=A0A3D8WUD0_PRIMG|nr:MarR family winged helix-turn-helix transcriptional regulator [Priestia megaterium]MDH3169150.1 MarR family winged helix-turn-helix transcriptional regulator [Priestia megaterium]MDH3169197.1 MarR family winged helix-turn-helix transcriptional regulator [Priestia megaterium]RDZ07679.1 MarR family transcriptional regulator [Priestia megaterium]